MRIKGEAARGAELKEVGVEDLEYHDGPAGARRVVAQESTQQLVGAHEGQQDTGQSSACFPILHSQASQFARTKFTRRFANCNWVRENWFVNRPHFST